MGVDGQVRAKVVPLRAASEVDLSERTLEEMLVGWRNQQLARNLSFATINVREAQIRRSWPMQASTRGVGLRSWWMSGWVISARCAICASRRSGARPSRFACSASI